MASPSERTARIIVADVVEGLRQLPDESVDCVVTSPPYWGLRDYGIDGQIGLERDPLEFVDRIVEVFREVRRVLAAHGTCWLNLGDTYASKARGSDLGWDKSRLTNPGHVQKAQAAALRPLGERHRGKSAGLKDKDLVGMPWRVALALQDDGWWLRSDVIWDKPNPMPQSMRDRPTVAHEYVFLLTKRSRYFYDAEALKEPASFYGPNGMPKEGPHAVQMRGRAQQRPEGPLTRNARTVWRIPTQPSADGHFAAFPEELPRRCIAAGCPLEVCRSCGKPRERLVDVAYEGHRGRSQPDADERRAAGVATVNGGVRAEKVTSTVGWTSCSCADYRTGVVLDPFAGSGTTLLEALRGGRDAIGIELNPEYAALAERRCAQWWRKPERPRAMPDAQLALTDPPEEPC